MRAKIFQLQFAVPFLRRLLVQSVLITTKDISEIVRLGRSIWPRYIQPLSLPAVGRTLTSVQTSLAAKNLVADRAPVQSETLTQLDSRILPLIRDEMEGMHSLGTVLGMHGDHGQQLPPHAKFLLIATFLCQVNRPGKDRCFFSIQRNGRRRRLQSVGSR